MKLNFIDYSDQYSSKYLLKCESDCIPSKEDKITIIDDDVNFDGIIFNVKWEYSKYDDEPTLYANIFCVGNRV